MITPVKTAALTALLILFSAAVFAQDPDLRWGRVSDEDLRMTGFPDDTSAAALVLFDVADLKFNLSSGDNQYDFTNHRRIKIFKRAGFDYADIAIPYYGEERLVSLKAQLILPNGEKSSVERGDFFEETYNNGYVKVKKFTFPNVQEGAIIEYQYTIKSPYILQLRAWEFQEDIPVRWSEYRLSIPKVFDYIVITQGREFDIYENSATTQLMTAPSSSGQGFRTVEVSVSNGRYVMKNLPALREEAYITTMDDYIAKIRFQLRSVNYPGEPPNLVMSSWEKLAENLINSESFGEQYTKNNKCRNVKALAPNLVVGAATLTEKADRLYNFLAKTMTWNDEFGIYVEESLDKCLELKTGSAADLNLMLVAMLQAVGIEAYPLLTSTRDHGKMFDVYPMLSQFNHVMVLAKLDGDKFQLFDIGSAHRPPGFPRIAALNGEGWAVIPGDPQWIDMRVDETLDQEVFKGSIDELGNLTGSWRSKREGYNAVAAREALSKQSAEEFLHKALEDVSPEASFESVTVQNQDSIKQALLITAETCSLPGAAMVSGDYIYLSPVLMPPFDETPFKTETRTFPVNIPYPFVEHRVLQLQLPEGYQVETLPERLSLALPERGASLSFSASVASNTLTINYKLEVKQLVFLPNQYGALREFFSMALQKQGEQIVLKRM